jgi:hypothetical protein
MEFGQRPYLVKDLACSGRASESPGTGITRALSFASVRVFASDALRILEMTQLKAAHRVLLILYSEPQVTSALRFLFYCVTLFTSSSPYILYNHLRA